MPKPLPTRWSKPWPAACLSSLQILPFIGKYAVRLRCTLHDSQQKSWLHESPKSLNQMLSAVNSRNMQRFGRKTSRGKNTLVKLLISPENWRIFQQLMSHPFRRQSAGKMGWIFSVRQSRPELGEIISKLPRRGSHFFAAPVQSRGCQEYDSNAELSKP